MHGNIVSAVSQFLTPDMVARMASASGIPDRATAQTGVAAAVPAILSSLANLASKPDGERRLADAIAKQSPRTLENLASATDGPAQLADAGKSLLSSLLGTSSFTSLASAIGRFAGLGDGQVRSLLGTLIPIILGVLGREAGAGANGLSQLLSSQRDDIAAAMPAGLSDVLRAGDRIGTVGAAAGRSTETYRPRRPAAPPQRRPRLGPHRRPAGPIGPCRSSRSRALPGISGATSSRAGRSRRRRLPVSDGTALDGRHRSAAANRRCHRLARPYAARRQGSAIGAGRVAEAATSRRRARPLEWPCGAATLRGARPAGREHQDDDRPVQGSARQREHGAGPAARRQAGDREPAHQARRAGDDARSLWRSRGLRRRATERPTWQDRQPMPSRSARISIATSTTAPARGSARSATSSSAPTPGLPQPSSASAASWASARRRSRCPLPRCRSCAATTTGTSSSRERATRSTTRPPTRIRPAGCGSALRPMPRANSSPIASRGAE